MRKRFLASGAMIVGASLALSMAADVFGGYNPYSLYSFDDDPVWKRARCEENYWAMVRKYNR